MRMFATALLILAAAAPAAHANRFQAEARCGSVTMMGTPQHDPVDAINDAMYRAAGGRFAPKDCEATKLLGSLGVTVSDRKLAGAISITPGGHWGRGFRKHAGSAEAEATAAAEHFCREDAGKFADDCKTFAGRGWLAGVRCREGDGSQGKMRFVGFGQDADLLNAVTMAFRDGAKDKLPVASCRLRTIIETTTGERYPEPKK